MRARWQLRLATAILAAGIGLAGAACQATGTHRVDEAAVAEGQVPRPKMWVTYSGELGSNKSAPLEGRVAVLEGGGYLGSFTLMLRQRNRDGSIDAELSPDSSERTPTANLPTRLLVRPDGQARLTGAALLVGAATLDLPESTGGTWFDAIRQNSAGRGSGQISGNGRQAGLHVDLLADRPTPAQHICRSLVVDDPGRLVSDRCSIEAILDRRDGWPNTLRISRSKAAADGSQARESVTFWRAAGLVTRPPRR
jgi:hypothetical protein